MRHYGFIGTGSMGSMLIRKIIGTGLVAPSAIFASSKSGQSARALAGMTGISAESSNRSVAGIADILFICVKPLEVRGVLEEVRDVLKPGALLVSIAGCVSLGNLRNWAGDSVRCVRIIPSVTAEENAGVSLVAWGHGVKPEDKNRVLNLLNAISTAMEIEERDFDLYTDLTSCGPALIVAMMREYARVAFRTGSVPPDLAEYLVKETMVGTARILEDECATFDTIIGRVATEGGSTEEGIKVLEARLPAVMEEVLRAVDEKRRVVSEKVTCG